MNDEDECDNLLPDVKENLPVTRQPLGVNKEYGACNQLALDTSDVKSTESAINRPRSFSSLSAPAGLNTFAVLSPVVSTASLTVNNDVPSDEITQNDVAATSPPISNSCSGVTSIEGDRFEPEGSSDISEEDVLKLVGLVEQCVGKFSSVLILYWLWCRSPNLEDQTPIPSKLCRREYK